MIPTIPDRPIGQYERPTDYIEMVCTEHHVTTKPPLNGIVGETFSKTRFGKSNNLL